MNASHIHFNKNEHWWNHLTNWNEFSHDLNVLFHNPVFWLITLALAILALAVLASAMTNGAPGSLPNQPLNPGYPLYY